MPQIHQIPNWLSTNERPSQKERISSIWPKSEGGCTPNSTENTAVLLFWELWQQPDQLAAKVRLQLTGEDDSTQKSQSASTPRSNLPQNTIGNFDKYTLPSLQIHLAIWSTWGQGQVRLQLKLWRTIWRKRARRRHAPIQSTPQSNLPQNWGFRILLKQKIAAGETSLAILSFNFFQLICPHLYLFKLIFPQFGLIWIFNFSCFQFQSQTFHSLYRLYRNLTPLLELWVDHKCHWKYEEVLTFEVSPRSPGRRCHWKWWLLLLRQNEHLFPDGCRTTAAGAKLQMSKMWQLWQWWQWWGWWQWWQWWGWWLDNCWGPTESQSSC